MKKFLLILLLTPISLFAFSQIYRPANFPQHSKDTIYQEVNTSNKQWVTGTTSFPFLLNSNNFIGKPLIPLGIDHEGNSWDTSRNNIRNIKVARNPEQVLISKDDQFAFIRCFMSDTVQIIKISTGEIVKSFSIPMPNYCSISNDGTKLLVGSLTDTLFGMNPPPADDCDQFLIQVSGKSILTVIDIPTQEIIKVDTINIWTIDKILRSSVDSIIYLVSFIIGSDVVEFNLSSNTILRRWQPAHQIWESEIDNKNKRIILPTPTDSLKEIDLTNGNVLSVPYYTHGQYAYDFYIGLDTLSNRIFVQGLNTGEYLEVLVFDAISLDHINTIDSACMDLNCFLACPSLGSIFVSGEYGQTLELDYLTLEQKKKIPLPLEWNTIVLDSVNNKLYSFLYGAAEYGGAQFYPPNYLDIIEYDTKTGDLMQYFTTDNKYGCSYERTIAITKDGMKVIATNSPENTISILDLSHEGISEKTTLNVIEIHPNPTTDLVNVLIKNPFDSDYTIEIYSILGVLMQEISKNKSETNFTIDLTKYPKGQYLIQFKSGNQFFVRKIIKI
jgi:DNA-binding beta-propeller fold protein YncE